MNIELVRFVTQEEKELEAKRTELAQLEVHLADQELFLANLKAELAVFEGQYLRHVGVHYAQLDEWNARLAELHAKRTSTPESEAEAVEARKQAGSSYSAAHSHKAQAPLFIPSPELKKLYREAAKQVHPDTAADEVDRAQRERLMQQVNAAYAAGDEDALRRILSELSSRLEAGRDLGASADLIHVLRQLSQISARLAIIELEIANLSETDLAKLKAKSDIAVLEGRDLLAEMASAVQARVNLALRKYERALFEDMGR